MNTPTIGSLFSGYGGLDLAAADVYGAAPIWHCEFDVAPSRILAHHWPDVPNLHDVTAVDWSTVERPDILTGGFPCQDVSVAGRRAGMNPGTRSGLWAHMAHAIDVLRPGLVIIENVGGLFSAEASSVVESHPWCLGDGGAGEHTVLLRAIDSVLGTLSELGYDAQWTALRAADVGAPHGRLRVFISAHPAGQPWGVEHGDGRALAYPGGRGSGGGSPVPVAGEAGEPHATPHGPDHRPAPPGGAPGLTLLPTPAVNDMGAAYTPDQWDEWTDRMKAAHGNGNGHGKSLSVEALRMLPTPGANLGANGGPQDPAKRRAGGHSVSVEDAVHGLTLLPTPSVADTQGGRKHRSGNRSDELLLNGIAAAGRFGPYAPAIARWEHVLGRPAPSPTEPGKTRPRLAADFVEWLMGLPAGHVTGESVEQWRARLAARRESPWPVGMRGSVARRGPNLTRNQQLKALGNGVVPQQAAAALRHLHTITHLEET